uniref:Uncharacterized protein n=1 Tax=Arundo donax TaxID=35708 RepID=A0A0A9C6Y0_ARUDO
MITGIFDTGRPYMCFNPSFSWHYKLHNPHPSKPSLPERVTMCPSPSCMVSECDDLPLRSKFSEFQILQLK